MKEFLFSIWFISLSSNLKLSIDIFIMSVSHVFADFRFIFVKCSCSRGEAHCFLYFIKLFYIFRALDCDQNATIFWECASKNLTWSTCASAWSACQPQHIVAGERFHWSGASASVVPGFTPHACRAEAAQKRAYAEREQHAPIVLSLAASAQARRCTVNMLVFL